jgi:hypothetical protein
MRHARRRNFYDLDSLETAVRHFEHTYRIDSDAFFDAYVANDVPDRVSRFDAHVWASFVEDIRRLRQSTPPPAHPFSTLASVQSTFAHSG